VIHANIELQHELQQRCDDVVLLSTRLFLSILNPRYTLEINHAVSVAREYVLVFVSVV
jgi:hypothetical protein